MSLLTPPAPDVDRVVRRSAALAALLVVVLGQAMTWTVAGLVGVALIGSPEPAATNERRWLLVGPLLAAAAVSGWAGSVSIGAAVGYALAIGSAGALRLAAIVAGAVAVVFVARVAVDRPARRSPKTDGGASGPRSGRRWWVRAMLPAVVVGAGAAFGPDASAPVAVALLTVSAGAAWIGPGLALVLAGPALDRWTVVLSEPLGVAAGLPALVVALVVLVAPAGRSMTAAVRVASVSATAAVTGVLVFAGAPVLGSAWGFVRDEHARVALVAMAAWSLSAALMALTTRTAVVADPSPAGS